MQSNLYNVTMQKGLILGLIFSVNFIFSISQVPILSSLGLPILALIIYLILKFGKEYRDKHLGGSISYRHAFSFVFLLIIFGNIILAGVKYVYFQFINPEFLVEIMNDTLVTLEGFMPITDAMYETTEMVTEPITNVLMGLLGNVFIAILGGLIFAGILKKDRNPFENNEVEQF